MNATQETYIDKINKLLRKAESTTPQEAESLFAKAQELMAKYAIDEAMLAAAKDPDGKASPIQNEEWVVVGIYRYPLGKLSWYTMHYNDIQSVKLSDPGWRKVGEKVFKETEVYHMFGTKSDLDRVKMLMTSLQLQALRAESVWWKENGSLYAGMSKGEQHRARRGFLYGFAEGASFKMRDTIAKVKADAEKEYTGTSVALVLLGKEQRIVAERDKHYPSLRNVKDRKNHGDAFARGSGQQEGRKADVGQDRVGTGRAGQLNS